MTQSSGCPGTLGKILAGILALTVIVILPSAVLASDTAHVIFSSDAVTELLRERLIHSGMLRGFVVDALSSTNFLESHSTGEMNMGEAFAELTPAEWDAILEVTLPEAWIDEQVGALTADIMGWIDDSRPWPTLEVDLQPIKGKLLRGGTREIVEIVVDSWPSCSPEQVQRMQEESMRSGESPLLYCEPPEPFRGQLTEYATIALDEFIRAAPGVLPLRDEAPGVDAAIESLTFKENLRAIRQLSYAGWMLPIASLGLIMVFAVRSWREVMQWWGFPLLAAAILTLLGAFLVPAAGKIFLQRVTSGLAGDVDVTQKIIVELFAGAAEMIAGRIIMHGIIMLFVSFLVLFLGWLLHRVTIKRGAIAFAPVESWSGARQSQVDVDAAPPSYPPPPEIPPMTQERSNAADAETRDRGGGQAG
jgi:hypothetical protein